MKLIFLILTIFLISICFGHKKKALNSHTTNTANQVCFVTKFQFHMTDLDKDDAAILNGYVVNIGYEQAKKLSGKKIRITGKVVILNDSNNHSPGQPTPHNDKGLISILDHLKLKSLIKSKIL